MNGRGARIALRGVPGAAGIGVGAALVWGGNRPAIPRRTLEPSQVRNELERLRLAIDASRRELEAIREALRTNEEADYGVILDAHLLMHGDALLVGAVGKAIASECINAEWALRKTIDRLKASLKSASSEYFRARADDVEHVGEHILRHLSGALPVAPVREEPTILVAEDLTPADAARLSTLGLSGIVLQRGSPSSHTAIVARALEVPTVLGVRAVFAHVEPGDDVIVDGLHGEVVVRPEEEERARGVTRRDRYLAFRRRLRESKTACATRDGIEIALHANVDGPDEVVTALAEGASGIGLLRTEFLFLDRDELPSEDEQYEAYRSIVRAAAGRDVVFRTFDLGGDKLPSIVSTEPPANPALGLRATRFLLGRPDFAKPQLRAILRAATEGNVRLMFPLVTAIDELRALRELTDTCLAELAREGLPHARVPTGMMVEVPATAILAHAFAKEAEFFAVGTNDLVQYTLAADRGNPDVAHLARALDPAVLSLLRALAEVAATAALPLSICGDMATDALALPILVGLGYRTLSVPVGSLAFVRESIRRLDVVHARAVAQEALAESTAMDVQRRIVAAFGESLGDLWEEQGIDG